MYSSLHKYQQTRSTVLIRGQIWQASTRFTLSALYVQLSFINLMYV